MADLIERRSLKTRTFDLGNGQHQIEIHTAPIHFLDDTGAHQPIDTYLSPTATDPDFTHRCDTSTLKVAISKFRTPLHVERRGRGHLMVAPLGRPDNITGVKSQNKVTYADAYDQTDVERTVTSWGFKQNYVLKAPGHPSSFSNRIETQYTLKPDGEGGVHIKDGDEIVYFIRRPYLIDANSQAVSRSWAINGQDITVDLSDVDFSELSYPVELDPTISPYAAAGDGMVRTYDLASWAAAVAASSGTQADHTTGSGQWLASVRASDSQLARGFLPFDTSAIGGGTPTAATMYVYIDGVYGTSTYRVVPGNQASVSSLATSDYSLPGSTAYSSDIGTASLGAGAYRALTLNATGIAAINTSGYTKLAVRDVPYDIGNSSPGDLKGLTLRNSEYTGTASDPYLSVTYSAASTYSSTHTLDASIKAIIASTHTLDTIIKEQLASTHNLDGLVLERVTSAHTVDGVVKEQVASAHGLDAIVRQTATDTHQLDGSVKAALAQTHQIDGLILGAGSLVHQLDGVIKAQSTTAHQLDGNVAERLASTHDLDGVIASPEATATHELDGIVLVTEQTAHGLDGLVKMISTAAHDLDGLIASRAVETHQLDGVLREALALSHSLDGRVVDPNASFPALRGSQAATSGISGSMTTT